MSQESLIGKIILGYTVTEKIDAGSFGTVYKVIKTNASGSYIRALKHIRIPTDKQYRSVLNSMGGDKRKVQDYFEHMLNNIVTEIKILNELSELETRNIVRYYENDIVIEESPKRYDVYILMEYLMSLDKHILTREYTVNDVVKMAQDILSGIRLCHDYGIVHRDIKEENIFVSDRGEYKIGDFGVSKILKDTIKMESLKGTPNYLAPEVYLGREGYNKTVDLYSLGIVVYKLLNYGRGPFLPQFPEEYFEEDENKAFEKRMSGKKPALPVLGGEKIGNVVVTAISNSEERFKTAREFIDELAIATENTSVNILCEKVDISSSSKLQSGYQSNSTVSLMESIQLIEKETKKENNEIKKGEKERVGSQQEESVKRRNFLGGNTGNVPSKTDRDIIDSKYSAYNKIHNNKVTDKHTLDKFVFSVPIILILMGIGVYFVLIPNIYGKSVSLIQWIIANPQNIRTVLSEQAFVISNLNGILGIKMFWIIWLAALITSLFFIGKQLQAETMTVNQNAKLKNKEPYFLVMEVTRVLKNHENTPRLKTLFYLLKKMEEKLSVESDFGFGESNVINCENEIAYQFQLLENRVSTMEEGDIDLNIDETIKIITYIDSLLYQRMELKKK